MLRYAILILASSVAFTSQNSYASDSVSSESIARTVTKAGASTVKLWMSKGDVDIPRSGLPVDRQSALLEQTLTEYARTQNSYYFASTLTRQVAIGVEAVYGNAALYGAGAVAIGLTAPVTLSVGAVVLGAAAVLTLESSADFIESTGSAKGRQLLAAKKSEIFEAVGMTSFAEMKGNLDLVRQRMENSAGLFEDLRDRSIGDQKLRDFAIDITMKNLAATDAALLDGLVIQADRVTEIETSFSTLVEGTAKYRETVSLTLTAHGDAIGALSENVTLLAESVSVIDGRLQSMGRDQSFISDFVLDGMPARQKASALRAGFLKERFGCEDGSANCDAAQLKEDLIVRFQREADIKDTIEDVGKVLQGISGVAQIADNLGVELPGDVGKALAIGNAAFGAVTQFYGGNPIGALASITGIFAKKKKDPDAERHKIMMAYLTRNFEIINAKLDTVLDNQKAIFDAVIDLTEEMRRNFAAVDARLADLKFAVNVNSDGIKKLIWRPWKDCNAVYSIARDRNEYGEFRYLNNHSMKFVSFDDARRAGKLLEGNFKKCQNLILAELGSFNALDWFGNFIDVRHALDEGVFFDPNTLTEEQKEFRSDLQVYEADFFTPAQHFAHQAAAAEGMTLPSLLKTLSTPAPTIHELTIQIEEAKGQKLAFRCWNGDLRSIQLYQLMCDGRGGSPDAQAKRLLSRPLLADVALDISEWVMVIAQLSDIFDNGAFYATFEEFLDASDSGSKGHLMIQRSLGMIDLVIASYNQMYGGLTAKGVISALDAIHDADDSNRADRFAEATAAIRLLRNNPYLAENVATLMLDRSYDTTRRSAGDPKPPNEDVYRFSWSFAENTGDLAEDRGLMLEGLFKGLSLVFSEEGEPKLHLQVAEEAIDIPFPAPDQFSNGRLVFPPRYYALLRMRDRLVDRLYDYDILSVIDDQERADFAVTLVTN